MARVTGHIEYRATLDASRFKRGAREMERSQSNLGRSARTLTGRIGDLALATGVSATDLLRFAGEAAHAGMVAEQVAISFDRTFGPSTERLGEDIDRLANRLGLTTAEAQGLLIPVGQLATDMGLSRDEAADFASTMLEVGGALSEFNPAAGDTDAAISAIGAALRGENDPLEQFGIKLSAAKVNARALELTGKDLTSELTDQERAMAILSLVTDGAADELDQFREGQQSTISKTNETKARLRELKEVIGTELVQALGENEDAVDDVITALEDLSEVVGPLIQLVAFLAGEVGDVVSRIGGISQSVKGAITAFKEWRSGARSFLDVIRSINAALYKAIQYLGRLPGGGTIFGDWAAPPSQRRGSQSTAPRGVTGNPDYPWSFPGGGRVPGPLGRPMPAIVHGGEMISGINGGSGGGGGPTIVIQAGIGDPNAIARQVVDALQTYNRTNGPIPIVTRDVVGTV